MHIAFDALLEFVAPLWVELSFFLFFVLGYAGLRFDTRRPVKGKSKMMDGYKHPQITELQKHVDAEFASGHHAAVINLWRSRQANFATPLDTLKLVAEAFAAHDAAASGELLDHITKHPRQLANPRAATVLLEVFARTGHIGMMEELEAGLESLHIVKTSQVYEVLLGGYAAAGRVPELQKVLQQIADKKQKPTPRGYALAIRGLTKTGNVEAAIQIMAKMRGNGLFVPSHAVENLLRAASDSPRIADFFAEVKDFATVSAEIAQAVLERRRGDLGLAHAVEAALRDAGTTFTKPVYDALLKAYAVGGDPHAKILFAEMRASSITIPDGLCVGLLARCADGKFLDFAKEIADHMQTNDTRSLMFYSSLMKVYAHCGLLDKACDLYDEIVADGLEPDSMMYGCLMKFAAECGRTDLSRTLSEKAPCLDIQNYMSLIRAAGRDKNVEQAFAVLERLKKSGIVVDLAAYNCVLDVCSSCGDMKRAHALVTEIKCEVGIDIITLNTLLKGYCQQRDLVRAKSVMRDMNGMGHKPNDISYNLYLNAAMTVGNFEEAWETVECIEKHGMVDVYTVSILMKGLKKSQHKKRGYLERAFGLLKKYGIDVFSDEILLNTTMEACMSYKDTDRIDALLVAFYASGMRPEISTYGMLIKAASTLRRVDTCWSLWRQAVEERSLKPDAITLGCMLDALVTSRTGRCVDEAASLFDAWKGVVAPNAVLYSTLAKGFAYSREPGRAMELWRDMRAEGVRINTVVCNMVIDAQARCGEMDRVTEIVAVMEREQCRPDAITFSIIIKGYCFKGNLDKALEVFYSTQKSGLVKDAVIYNTLLDGCMRHDRFELAEQLVEDMEKHDIAPSNFTLVNLVQLYSRRRDLVKAFSVAKSVSRRCGFPLNTQVKTCLITACLHNRDIDRALQAFAEFRSEGDGLDSRTYGALLSGCLRFGRLTEAVALVEEAYGLTSRDSVRGLPKGESIERDRIEHLMRSLKGARLMEAIGLPLLTRLRGANEPMATQILLTWRGGETGGRRCPSN